MDEKIEEVIRFYLMTNSLKYKVRQGWIYWNVYNDRLESIAEHVYGTCNLAFAFYLYFDLKINIEKVIMMLACHETEEIKIGDKTDFDSTLQERLTEGEKAVKDILGKSNNSMYIYNLLNEFNARETEEAKFAYMCDKLEWDIQSKIYEDMGCHHLDHQENNPAFNSPVVQDIIRKGAMTVADICIEYDRSKFSDSEIFTRALDYIKRKDTREL